MKNAEYRATQSVQRYLILQQTRPAAIVFARKGADWVTELLTQPDTLLNLAEIGCSICLHECYTDLDLSAASTAQTSPSGTAGARLPACPTTPAPKRM